MPDEPDVDRVQDRAERRQERRAEVSEAALERADELLGNQKFPVTSEELAAEYANEPLDLPNETESLGSAFDRLTGQRFGSAADAREALYPELTGPAGPDSEYNRERDLRELDESAQDDRSDGGASDM